MRENLGGSVQKLSSNQRLFLMLLYPENSSETVQGQFVLSLYASDAPDGFFPAQQV